MLYDLTVTSPGPVLLVLSYRNRVGAGPFNWVRVTNILLDRCSRLKNIFIAAEESSALFKAMSVIHSFIWKFVLLSR